MLLSSALDLQLWRGNLRLVILLALLIGGVLSRPSTAQREPGSVTVGLEVGHLGGGTAKVYRPGAVAYSSLLTTDGDDFVTLYLHRLQERPVADSLVHLYYGPGLYGSGQQLDTTPTLQAGVSAQVGFNFYDGRFEVFLHATPILRVRPSLVPRLAGSVGLRYDLFQAD